LQPYLGGCQILDKKEVVRNLFLNNLYSCVETNTGFEISIIKLLIEKLKVDALIQSSCDLKGNFISFSKSASFLVLPE
jgi:hypothetical protein